MAWAMLYFTKPTNPQVDFFLKFVLTCPAVEFPFFALLILICFGVTFSYSHLVSARVLFDSFPQAKHSGQHIVVRGVLDGQPITRYK